MDSLKSVPPCILAGHLCFSERDDSHCAPTDGNDAAAMLDGLRSVGGDFRVLELHSRDRLEQKRRIVDQELAERGLRVTKEEERAERAPRTGVDHALT